MQILKCATCESTWWENKTPLHSQRNIYCSPFTIHLPANIPMTTRETMITSKVFASSEVPIRTAAAMEKRLFISKVPFLQSNRKRDRLSWEFLSCRSIPSVSPCPKLQSAKHGSRRKWQLPHLSCRQWRLPERSEVSQES